MARGDESGAAVVEMALSFSVLFVMFLGIVQLSIALYANDFLSQAAREGARWAIVRGGQCHVNTPGLAGCPSSGAGASQSDIQTHVQGLGYPFASQVTVTATWLVEQITLDSTGAPTTTWVATCTPSGTATLCPNGTTSTKLPGDQVNVTVSYLYPLSIPFWHSANIQMTSTSAMVISQ
jgi:Flp pilus assembly protein TadG